MKIVKVYGALRKRLGGQKRFELDVSTPAEAIKALVANFPGLDDWLINSENEGLFYRAKVGVECYAEEDLATLYLPWSEKEVFVIEPIYLGAFFKQISRAISGAGKAVGRAISGAAKAVGRAVSSVFKSSAGKIITGVAIAALAIVAAPASATFFGGLVKGGGGIFGMQIGGLAATAMVGLGTSVALSGVSQAISPTPSMPGALGDYGSGGGGASGGNYDPVSGQGATRLESFSISGITNVSRQGLPCGIVYGRCFVGSAILSQGFDVDQK
jgi:predicted phage tail protein